jgi:hypothetical protein
MIQKLSYLELEGMCTADCGLVGLYIFFPSKKDCTYFKEIRKLLLYASDKFGCCSMHGQKNTAAAVY